MAWETGDKKPTNPLALTLESWSQGFMVGAILIMISIALANTRKGVALHKLIVIEVEYFLCPNLAYTNNSSY